MERFEDLGSQFSLVGSAGTDRDSITGKQPKKSHIGHRSKHIESAFVNGIGDRNAKREFAVGLNRWNAGNHKGNIVGQDQLGENLQPDEISADTVKVIHTDTIFQEKERGFDFPAQMIQIFQI